MAAYLPFSFDAQFFTDAGAPTASYKLYTYANGTTTDKATYTTAAGNVAHSNPITLNSAGRPPTGGLFLASGAYSLELKTSAGVLVKRWDDVTSAADIDLPSDALDLTYTAPRNGAVERTVKSRLGDRISVKDYEATGDGTTDDTAAIQAAFDALVTAGGGILYFPMGSYRTTEELDFYRANSPRVDVEIWGDGQHSTKIVADFFGAEYAVIKSHDPLETTRSSPISFHDIGMEHETTSGGVNPVFLDILGWGESRMRGIRFGSTNNSVARFGGAQNVRIDDFVSFFAGKHFNYKDTTGITFDVDGAGEITASAAIFSAGDVGKLINIFPSNVNRRSIYTISAFTDTTHVDVSETTLTETGADAYFEPARCSITSGDSTVTANAACFAAEDVGRVIYIRGAKAGAYGDGLLRGTIITFNSTTSVEIDIDATNTVSNAPFAVPVVDFYQAESGAFSTAAGADDIKIDRLHIEKYRGVALVTKNAAGFWMDQSKLHGYTAPNDEDGSNSAMWLDDTSGEICCDMESSCSYSDCRVFWCNANDTITWRGATRGIINNVIFKSDAVTDDGGYLFIEFLNSYVDRPDPEDQISDANYDADPADGRILFSGPVNMLGDSQTPRHYVGRGTYFGPDGSLTTAQSIDDTIIGSTITWDGTPPSGGVAQRYIWEKIGRFVDAHFRLDYPVAGTTNSTVTIELPADMPTPESMNGQGNSEIAYPALGFLGTSAASTSLSRAVLQKNGSGVFEIVVALNSGTISAAFCTVQVKYPAAL